MDPLAHSSEELDLARSRLAARAQLTLSTGEVEPARPDPPGFWAYLRSFRLGGLFLESYLIKEMIRPFFLGVAGGTTLLLGNQLFLYTDLLVKKGVDLVTILQILVLNLPAILVVTFPIAGLFATLLTLGKMGADSEITALRSAGISYRKLFVPVLVIGLMISLMAFLTNDYIVPLTNQKVKRLNENLFFSKDAVFFNEDQMFKVDDHLWFYIGEIERDTGLMKDVLILDRTAETGVLRYPQVITSEQARQDSQTWYLQGAVVRRYDDDGQTYYEGQVGEMDLNIGDELANYVRGDKVPQEQSSRELGQQIEEFSQDPNHDPQFLLRLQTEWHLKFAIPFASFFAILIAAPLGLQAVRQTGRYGGVAVAIVLVFIYYVLLSLGRSMGRAGILDPWLAAWLPNMVFGALGSLMLLWRFTR